MISQSTLFIAKQTELPLFIMLSGLPGTGKTTFRYQLLDRLKSEKFLVAVISSDDIAFEMANELSNKLHKKISYSDICNKYHEQLEVRIKEKIIKSSKQNSGIVILDRTYLSAKYRKEVISLIGKCRMHLVYFNISDQDKWLANLEKRNKENTEKIISFELIKSFKLELILPDLNEGFASIVTCPAVSESSFRSTSEGIISNLLSLIKIKPESALYSIK